MGTKNLFLRWSFLTLGILITVALTSCSYCPGGGCEVIANAPLKELTSSDRNVVFEEQGTIIVFRGFGCARSDKDGTEDVIKVEQSLNLPAYATNATVFLNGWRMQYRDKDHEVAGLATAIGNISLERNTLKWQATGVLSDQNFDDAYSWCYNYTVIGWNPSNLNLTVDHDDGSCDPNDSSDPSQANFFSAENVGTTTALSSFPSFLQNPAFAASKTVAVLPRGFGFRWSCQVDHNLLQIGYNLDHSEIFIEQGKKYKKKNKDVSPSLPNTASQVGAGFVSWETSAIFKDNDGRREYSFSELVSGLGGNDIGLIQPPFSILPEEDGGLGCAVVGTPGLRTEEFVIENVPFEFAIPMLTGWNLFYLCGDAHVKEIGIWIDEWVYEKTPGAAVGTLRYKLSSVLRDKKDFPLHVARHKVTVLGLRPTTGIAPLEKVPDLVPFSPLGDSPDKFCRIEQDRRQLRVTVKNQGNENAPASKTTVIFGNIPTTVNTPAIPAGGSVDLLFKVPTNCFQPDCSFNITVDSNNQVNESNNEGNNSANGGCIG